MVRGVAHRQALDLQQGATGDGVSTIAGAASTFIATPPPRAMRRRSPSPTRLKASTVMAMASPGKISAHGARTSVSRPS